MQLSVVVPTYQRIALLRDALASIAVSEVAQNDAVEVLVVDNSLDGRAAETVAAVRGQGFPFALHYLVEHRRGVSAARNRGIAQARGKHVVFMDDDQRIESNYLSRVPAAFARTGAAAIGGRIKYFNAENVPTWAHELIAQTGQFDVGNHTRQLTLNERTLNGGNMAISKAMLDRIGGFDKTLGRNGASLLAAEEREMQERIVAAGGRIFYTPELLQYHHLCPDRLTKRYWRKNRFDWGRTIYRSGRMSVDTSRHPRLLGVPRWFWSSLALRAIPRYLWSLATADSQSAFDRQLEIWVMLGRIYEAWSIRRTA